MNRTARFLLAVLSLLLASVALLPVPALAQSGCLSPREMQPKVDECTNSVLGAVTSPDMKSCIKRKSDAVLMNLAHASGCVSIASIGYQLGSGFGSCQPDSGTVSSRLAANSRVALKTEAQAVSRALVALATRKEKDVAELPTLVRDQCSGRCAYCCWLVGTFGYNAGQSCFWNCY
jgi:hypothetical protein